YARKISGFLDTADTWVVDDGGNQVVRLDLGAAKAIASELVTRAETLERRIDDAREAGKWTDAARAALNDRLARLEQTLLDESGSPAERWYRHVIYGWNIYSLYEGQPLPGLAEAIRVGDPAQIAKETARIESALRRMLAGLPTAGS